MTAPRGKLNYARDLEQRVWYWHTSKQGNERELPEWVAISELGDKLRENVNYLHEKVAELC
jgi:hypothetical protein